MNLSNDVTFSSVAGPYRQVFCRGTMENRYAVNNKDRARFADRDRYLWTLRFSPRRRCHPDALAAFL